MMPQNQMGLNQKTHFGTSYNNNVNLHSFIDQVM
jgi:hypothetical protein